MSIYKKLSLISLCLWLEGKLCLGFTQRSFFAGTGSFTYFLDCLCWRGLDWIKLRLFLHCWILVKVLLRRVQDPGYPCSIRVVFNYGSSFFSRHSPASWTTHQNVWLVTVFCGFFFFIPAEHPQFHLKWMGIAEAQHSLNKGPYYQCHCLR